MYGVVHTVMRVFYKCIAFPAMITSEGSRFAYFWLCSEQEEREEAVAAADKSAASGGGTKKGTGEDSKSDSKKDTLDSQQVDENLPSEQDDELSEIQKYSK